MKFTITSISIRVLAQVLFTHAYINKDVTRYFVTARA